MTLSKPTIETLIDLVEIKLSCLEVWDRDDRRELKALQSAREELREVCDAAGRAAGRPQQVAQAPSSQRVAVG
ncbi:hypothetical protein [Rhodovibrio salinarum]|uniref:Uncharacterized protein n=1 Tax=Rhodovibrio salinarum TaxID=1087 RepID=A0A934QJ90_9PROT|nr:hypothetical protein [Rhodovibrio salinarum]MBK1698048.1 hypothetical protein [Rhodovibrio salinarum]